MGNYLIIQKNTRNLTILGVFLGTLEGTRTPDLLIRSQSLYPTELPAHTALSQAPAYNSTEKKKMQVFF